MFVILLSLLPEDEQALILSIFDRYYGYMKKIAFSVLGNDEDAEDAVQDEEWIRVDGKLVKVEASHEDAEKGK